MFNAAKKSRQSAWNTLQDTRHVLCNDGYCYRIFLVNIRNLKDNFYLHEWYLLPYQICRGLRGLSPNV